jgi:hypothetical protein
MDKAQCHSRNAQGSSDDCHRRREEQLGCKVSQQQFLQAGDSETSLTRLYKRPILQDLASPDQWAQIASLLTLVQALRC